MIPHSIAMSTADSRLAAVSGFRTKQAPIKFFRITQLRRLCDCEQVAAVCYRVNGHGIEFLLVQTHNGRWTFPKGSAEPGLTHAQTAALEAFEEAGVHGRMEEASFSRYFRRRGRARREPHEQGIAVNTHLCEVSRLETPSERKRNRTWFSPEEAKRRLRLDRAPDYGAELARVVARAVVRIQRLHGIISLPRLDGPKLDVQKLEAQKKDALQKVQFTIVENIRGAAGRAKDRQLAARTLEATLQPVRFRRF